MRRSRRRSRLAAAAGLTAALLVAAVLGSRSYGRGETPAELETLERIARKNEAAALNAAMRMEERSEALSQAKQTRLQTGTPPGEAAPKAETPLPEDR